MAELARAHATYRFVILDEEEERPRILVRASRGVFMQVLALLIPTPSVPNMCFTIDVALQTEHATILQGH